MAVSSPVQQGTGKTLTQLILSVQYIESFHFPKLLPETFTRLAILQRVLFDIYIFTDKAFVVLEITCALFGRLPAECFNASTVTT